MNINRQLLREALWDDLKPVWAFLAGLAIAGVIWRLTRAFYASGLLELGGLLLVAWELWDLPKAWDELTPGQKAKDWIEKLRAAFRPRHYTLDVHSAHHEIKSHPVDLKVSIPKDAPTEQQIAFLRREVDRLHVRIDTTESKIKEEARKLRNEVEQEREDREARDMELEAKGREATIGDLHRAWIGLGWVIAGVLLGML